MGNLHTGPAASLVEHLRDRFQIRQFVETGTHLGLGTAYAAGLFDAVTTIEINDHYRRQAMENLQSTSVQFLLGDSATVMPQVVAGLSGPALFWLDGHAGGGNYGDHDDCPVLAELAAIAASPYFHFILIDDARAFVAPPPPPFDAAKWPPLAEVLDAVRRTHPYYCVVIEDMIICVPPEAKADIIAFCDRVRPRI